MTNRIAIVGTGPMAIYCLQQLLAAGGPLAVTLFERGDKAGYGMPYSPETASRTMLANIASIEIPPLGEPYLDWLERQPPELVRSFGLDPADMDERQFTPRLLLGRYFRDALLRMADADPRIAVLEGSEVQDVVPVAGGLRIDASGAGDGAVFDRVILATGHAFPEDEGDPHYFPSPWSGLIGADVPAARVGIMGTSLSSIDAAMAVAIQHGRFRRAAGDLRFEGADPGLRITLMSRTGILPEADFFCPIPHEPLAVMSDGAVAACAQADAPLDALFDLVRAELMAADPAYALRIGLGGLDADSFAPAYFAERKAVDPFRWARCNLDEVERNKASRITVPWRYAILRMHERVEDLVPHLSESDRARFDRGLKRVFVDNYAAVPSESIRRLLALRDAGVLDVLALGEDYELARAPAQTTIRAHGTECAFDVFIDARGQKPMGSADLPFPTLRGALLAQGIEIPELAEDYSLLAPEAFRGRVTLASIPFLMHDRPFVQGITACAEIARAVAGAIRTGRRRRLVS